MRTRISQDQVSGLPEELSSLENFISIEDSIGDSIDQSQDEVLQNLQEQIDIIKLKTGGLIFPTWIIDLMDNSSVEFYAVQDTKINTITNIVGSPTITIADDGAPYTLTNTILSGSKITVTSDIQSVIKLNIEY